MEGYEKSLVVILCMGLCLILSSCSHYDFVSDNTDWEEPIIGVYDLSEKDSIQKIFDSYPEKILFAEVEQLNAFIIVHGEAKNQKIWDDFVSSISKNENAALVTVQYTIEGDPIFEYVSYTNGYFYYACDISRDAWGGDESPTTFFGPYPFLVQFSREGYLEVLLSKVEYGSWNEYQLDEYNNSNSIWLFQLAE